MKKTNIDHYTDKEALDFHKDKKPGKIEIHSSKSIRYSKCYKKSIS